MSLQIAHSFLGPKALLPSIGGGVIAVLCLSWGTETAARRQWKPDGHNCE